MKKIIRLLFSSAVIAVTFLGSKTIAQSGGSGVSWPTGSGLPTGDIKTILMNFLKWLLVIFGFLAIISFVVSGIMYFMASGDDKEAEKAKKQMYWSIIGVIVGLMGYIIIQAVDTWLRGSGTDF